MIWLPLIKRYWRFIAAALLLIAVVVWYRSQISAATQQGYERAQIEFAQKLDRERREWLEHQTEVNNEIDREYYAEKTELQRRVRRLLASGDAIRVCKPASSVRDAEGSAVTDAAGGADGHAFTAGPDIRGRLVEYGAGCEGLRRQVSAWQEWYSAHQR